jgi:hypothetical protein
MTLTLTTVFALLTAPEVARMAVELGGLAHITPAAISTSITDDSTAIATVPTPITKSFTV